MAETIYSKIGRKPFLTLCIVITVCYLAVMGVLIALTATTHTSPADLKTATGTVTKLKYKTEENVIDHIVNSSTYFNVTLDNETYYETIGVSFKNIDKDFFNEIAVGAEITIIYKAGSFLSSNRIYGIDYNGKTYLNHDDVLADLNKEHKTACIVYYVLMGVATLLAVGLIFLSYKKVKTKTV